MSDTPRVDRANGRTLRAVAREIERENTDLRASLRREENAREILAKENDRLRAVLRGKTFVTDQTVDFNSSL